MTGDEQVTTRQREGALSGAKDRGRRREASDEGDEMNEERRQRRGRGDGGIVTREGRDEGSGRGERRSE